MLQPVYMVSGYIPRIKTLLPCVIVKKLIIGPIFAVYNFYKSVQLNRKCEEFLKKANEIQSLQQKINKIQDLCEREKMKEAIKKDKIKADKKLRKMEQNLKAAKLKNEQKEIEDKKAIMAYQESMKESMESRLKEIEDEYNQEDMKGGDRESRKKMKKGRKIVDLSEPMNHTEHEDSSSLNGEQPAANGRRRSIEEVEDNGWSQYQQKQLEWALGHYTKDVENRWDKITKAVPGKSKVCVQ